VWEQVLAERTLTRVIVTHYHPDHVGLAGWLTERSGLELSMSQTEYLFCQNMRHNPAALGGAMHRQFYRQRGLDDAAIDAVMGRGHHYTKLTTELPPVYRRLVAGERLRIGEREFEILTGGGHAPEQVMLLNRDEGLFFAADQVLARISPNIGVWPWEPLADPLGDYLRSLADLRRIVPDDVLALPAHNLPFYGLHQRLADLERHHALRCAEIVAACADAPRTVAEVLPVLFPRALDAHQTGFAFGEVLAHVNHMVRRGELAIETDAAGLQRIRRR
jgi:glyoxylase-like metal-dependent hydrolase (beta-lactamase superfamily II)